MSNPNPAEHTFMDEGAIRVTNARFIVGKRTYAMHGITSVSLHEKRQGWIGALTVAAFGLFFLCASIASFIAGGHGVKDLFVGVGVFLFLGSIAVAVWFGCGPSYSVRLATASGESEALMSRDRARAQRVVDALNDAIVARGGS